MLLKQTFFKWLDKLENLKITPLWGYSFVVSMLLSSVALNAAQLSVSYGGGGFVKIWFYLAFVLEWAAFVLFALTKKIKRYGMKISRIFAIIFVFITLQVWRLLPSQAQMYGDCYVDPMDMVMIIFSMLAGFVGYYVGKQVAEKIKSGDMASVKIKS